MTIEINSPELEAIIRSRMSAGQNAEEVIMQALKSSPAAEVPPHTVVTPRRPVDRKSLAQLFADSPFKGLDIDFERDNDYGRDATL
jgi:hypothetical protein